MTVFVNESLLVMLMSTLSSLQYLKVTKLINLSDRTHRVITHKLKYIYKVFQKKNRFII